MKNLLTILLVTLSFISYSQKFKVKGKVIDENKQGLEAAMVVLLEAKDSTMIGYSNTNENGEFLIIDVPSTSTLLQITYIGYGTIQKEIDINGEVVTMDLGPITMIQDASLLKDVTISADYVPIKISKDTIEFNAEAFKVQPNANVEELLKKLPGVEVDNAGVITVKGEEVKAVTVDGKEFFGKDPKMATRNLPADAVKKVQFFDKKSKNSQFTGVDDGQEEKTINLELKEDRKNGIFGNAMAGYGTDNRFESKGILNKFSKKYQFSIIANGNNLNQQGVAASDAGSLGGTNRNSVFSGGAPINWGGGLSPGDIKSGLIGLNYGFDFSKDSKLNASYYLSGSNTLLDERTSANTFLGNRSLLSRKLSSQQSGQTSHSLYSNADIKIDSLTEFSLNVRGTFRDSDFTSTLNDTTSTIDSELLNRNEQSRENNQQNYSYSSALSARRKFSKKGRNITLNASYGANASDLINDILSSLYDANSVLNVAKSVYQEQDVINESNNYSAGLTYNEPISRKWTSTTAVNVRNNFSDQIKDFFDLDPNNTSVKDFNELLSRSFDNSFRYTTVGETFRYKIENFSSNIGLDYQNSQLVGQPSIGEKISNPYNYFLPNASIEWDKPSIRLNYNTNVREPSIDQLQPIVDNSDPLNVYIGNPELRPEYRHNLRLGIHHFDQFNFRSFFGNIRYTYAKDKITTATAVDQFGSRSSKPVNTDYESSLSAFGSYSSPLNFMKAKFRLGFNGSLTNGINIINEVFNKIDRYSEGVNFTLENKNKKTFDISATTRWSWNQNIYRDNETQNSSFINQSYEGAFILYAGKGWTIENTLNHNIYDQGSFDDQQSFSLWNASVSKLLFNNKWQIKLRAFDILNQNQGINRAASEYAITETISNTIGRYFMLTALYDIKSFSAASSGPPMMMMRH